jgi:hypothetical protein
MMQVEGQDFSPALQTMKGHYPSPGLMGKEREVVVIIMKI